MSGGKQRQPLELFSGYTLIEVMIFLAVSGVMFIIAASFINGKQAQVQFRNSVLLLQSNVRTAINDVENGTYISLNNFNCTSGALSGNPPTISMGSNGQGSNSGCIFLGKTLNFDAINGNYTAIGIAGNQTDSSGNTVTTVANARPAQIGNSSIGYTLVQQHNLGGVDLERMCLYPPQANGSPGPGAVGYSFGIIQSLNGSALSSTNGATQTANLYDGGNPSPIVNVGGPNYDPTPANASLGGPLAQVIIVVSAGSRHAYLTIANNYGLGAKVTFADKTSC